MKKVPLQSRFGHAELFFWEWLRNVRRCIEDTASEKTLIQWNEDWARLPEILHGVARTAHELTTNA